MSSESNWLRRTKIVCTLGPGSCTAPIITAMISAGMNVARINFSHGNAQEHKALAQLVRKLAKQQQRVVGILGDLQGPKIRIGRFSAGKVNLVQGGVFSLDGNLDINSGSSDVVGIDYANLPNDCRVGDCLLLDDGRIALDIESIDDQLINCRIRIGGVLSDNKGINKLGGGLSAPTLTEKDLLDISLAAEMDVDYLAVSFPRSAADIERTRSLLQSAGSQAGIIAKIERAEAVADQSTMDAIIRSSDAVMVARGDLGVEIGDASLAGVQKKLIKRARQLNRIVITATQMMESMITSPMPTRAEVFDVANAVLDGSDAVMLSGETAVGKFPVETVSSMARVITGAEKIPDISRSEHRLHQKFSSVDETIALSAMYAANHLDGVRAIVSMTETGSTPIQMSRISSNLPIFSSANSNKVHQKLALVRGVHSVLSEVSGLSPDRANQMVVDQLLDLGAVNLGDLVIISKGDYVDMHGGTNTLKIVRVGDAIK
ncbi:MAG: pyruvate kinase [Pseudomonadales bacterium]|nr:pyruvate kinase [Pseudomonadales bacterium]